MAKSKRFENWRVGSRREEAADIWAVASNLFSDRKRPLVVVATHDRYTKTFDRRTSLKYGVLCNLGYNVVVLSSTPKLRGRAKRLAGECVLWEVPSSRVHREALLALHYFPQLLGRIGRLLRPLYKHYPQRRSYLRLVKPFAAIVRVFYLAARHLYRFARRLRVVNGQKSFVTSLEEFKFAVGMIEPVILFVEDLPLAITFLGGRQVPSCPVVGDFHEIYPEQEAFLPREREFLIKEEKVVLQKLSRLIVTSSSVRSYYKDKYKEIPETFVIGNGGAPSSEPESSSQLIPISERFKGKEVFVYHGGLSANRGILNLVKTFRRLPDLHLVLLGYGDPLFLRALREHKSPNIEILSAVPATQLHGFLKGATGVVIPYPVTDDNTKFCFPNKLGDAINLGIPVLFHEGLENIATVAEAGGFGFPVPFSNPDRAADTILVNLGEVRVSSVPPEVVQNYGHKKIVETFALLCASLSQELDLAHRGAS